MHGCVCVFAPPVYTTGRTLARGGEVERLGWPVRAVRVAAVDTKRSVEPGRAKRRRVGCRELRSPEGPGIVELTVSEAVGARRPVRLKSVPWEGPGSATCVAVLAIRRRSPVRLELVSGAWIGWTDVLSRVSADRVAVFIIVGRSPVRLELVSGA